MKKTFIYLIYLGIIAIFLSFYFKHLTDKDFRVDITTNFYEDEKKLLNNINKKIENWKNTTEIFSKTKNLKNYADTNNIKLLNDKFLSKFILVNKNKKCFLFEYCLYKNVLEKDMWIFAAINGKDIWDKICFYFSSSWFVKKDKNIPCLECSN